jgi:hypothetical protein
MELNSLKGGVIKEKADQQYFTMYHWGPLLFKTKIRPEDIKALKELSQGENEVWSDNLAGIIKGEYKLDSGKYTKIITPYLKAYQKAYKDWYGLNLKAVETTAAWVNFMKKGESNPPHIHHNCHLSSTLIIEVPDEIKQEQKDWKGTGEGPGALSFFVANPQNFHTNSLAFKPEPGDFFIFPWNLTHSVSNFTSDVTRISIAANFTILDNNIFEKKDDKGKA